VALGFSKCTGGRGSVDRRFFFAGPGPGPWPLAPPPSPPGLGPTAPATATLCHSHSHSRCGGRGVLRTANGAAGCWLHLALIYSYSS
jgi:hypothetical protein